MWTVRSRGASPGVFSPPGSWRSQREADFERAWQMLTEGTEPTAVAQRLDMGVAEVELMQRMLRYRRQG